MVFLYMAMNNRELPERTSRDCTKDIDPVHSQEYPASENAPGPFGRLIRSMLKQPLASELSASTESGRRARTNKHSHIGGVLCGIKSTTILDKIDGD